MKTRLNTTLTITAIALLAMPLTLSSNPTDCPGDHWSPITCQGGTVNDTYFACSTRMVDGVFRCCRYTVRNITCPNGSDTKQFIYLGYTPNQRCVQMDQGQQCEPAE